MTQQAIKTAVEKVGSQAVLARLLGVTPSMVNQWTKGIRGVACEHCPAIEKATSGAVRCEDLRPDVDWTYLRGTACACEHKEVA